MSISIKRAYDAPRPEDGYRVLVDRLWPRGIKKESLQVNRWLKDIGPSDDLRRWFGHDPARFAEFADRYRQELDDSSAVDELLELAEGNDHLTLIYSAKDEQHNQAVVLQDYLQGRLK